MTLNLKPIKPTRIADQVLDQIRESIFRGQLKPGDRLMPERELAESLEVSRTTVREAINKLVATGFLEQHQGQGTFVRAQDQGTITRMASALGIQDATIADLQEVRLGLECNAAAMAAERATEKDFYFLEKSIADMEDRSRLGRQGVSADISFHMAITYATKNPVQVQIMKRFYDFLFVSIKSRRVSLYEEPRHLERIIRHHEEIYRCIKSHNPETAADAMRYHLSYALKSIRRPAT